jgi:hypothetical protein
MPLDDARPQPNAIGQFLMDRLGIYPSSQLPYAKPIFEPGSASSKFLTEALPLAMMGVRSGPGATKGNDAVIARSLERQNPYEFPFRGLALDANGEHYGLAVDTAKGLSKNPGMQPAFGGSSNPIWRGNMSANTNEAPYPQRAMDQNVTRFLRALDNETGLGAAMPRNLPKDWWIVPGGKKD